MNIELRFLSKAIEDKNFVSFSYEGRKIEKVKPLKLTSTNNQYTLHTQNDMFEYGKITHLNIHKEKF